MVATAYIDSDARAYSGYMAALRAARGRNAAERERILGPAFGGILSEPLKVARAAAEIADMGAELAVHRRPNLVVILEREADAVDRRDRHERRQDQARQREELDAAGPDLAQHVGIRTELVVRENLQVEPAIGLGLDRRRHFLGAGVHRMAVRKIIGVLVGKFGGLGPRHQRRANATQNR